MLSAASLVSVLLVLAACGYGGSASPSSSVDRELQQALKTWSGFPVDTSPRIFVLVGPRVLDPVGGFPSEEAKLACGVQIDRQQTGSFNADLADGDNRATRRWCLPDNAFTYDGTSWSSRDEVDPNGGALNSVSCPTASVCAAVDYDGNALTYCGSSWSSPDSARPRLVRRGRSYLPPRRRLGTGEYGFPSNHSSVRPVAAPGGGDLASTMPPSRSAPAASCVCAERAPA